MDKAIIKQFKEYATEMLNSFFAGKNKAEETYTMDNVHSEVKAYDDILEEFGFDSNFETEFLLPEMEKREKQTSRINLYKEQKKRKNKGFTPIRYIQYGDETTIDTADGNNIRGLYAVIELDTIIPSNNAFSFLPNPKFPAICQGRDYTEPQEQQKVERNAKNFNHKYILIDTADGVTGTPIITKEGIVLSGNSRAMTLQVLRKRYDYENSYIKPLLEKAKLFGIPSAQIQLFISPILVRVIDIDMNKCMTYSNLFQQSTTQEMSIEQEALSLSKQLQEIEGDIRIAKLFANSEYNTIAKLLGDRSISKKIINILEECSIITPHNRIKWFDGEFKDYAKNMVEALLIATVLPDERLMTNAKNYANKIIFALPLFIAMRDLPNKWDITADFHDALRRESQRRASGMTVKEYLSQLSFDQDVTPERTRIIWLALEKLGRNNFKKFMQSWIDQAIAQESNTMFDVEKAPTEILAEMVKIAGLSGLDVNNVGLSAGYDGYSKSNNAISAEENGLFPASTIAKKLKLNVKFIKDNFRWDEWHHTSKNYNKTYYYNISEIQEYIDENPNAFKEFKAKNKKGNTTKICKSIEWLEWSGTRSHPTAQKNKLENVEITYNGKSSYSWFNEFGTKITKRVGTKGFYINGNSVYADNTLLKNEGLLGLSALPVKTAKQYMKIWKEAKDKVRPILQFEDYFKNTLNTDWRHYIDNSSVSLDLENSAYKHIQDFLTDEYTLSVDDYIKGYVNKTVETRQGKKETKIKLGKVLQKLKVPKMVLTAYNNDTIRSNKDVGTKTVISRHPYDIAGMTADREWSEKSCMSIPCERIHSKKENNINLVKVGKIHTKDLDEAVFGRCSIYTIPLIYSNGQIRKKTVTMKSLDYLTNFFMDDFDDDFDDLLTREVIDNISFTYDDEEFKASPKYQEPDSIKDIFNAVIPTDKEEFDKETDWDALKQVRCEDDGDDLSEAEDDETINSYTHYYYNKDIEIADEVCTVNISSYGGEEWSLQVEFPNGTDEEINDVDFWSLEANFTSLYVGYLGDFGVFVGGYGTDIHSHEFDDYPIIKDTIKDTLGTYYQIDGDKDIYTYHGIKADWNKTMPEANDISFAKNIDDYIQRKQVDWLEEDFGRRRYFDNNNRDGAYSYAVNDAVTNTLIAYEISNDDTNIEKPLSRLLISSYYNENNEQWAIAPNPRGYGNVSDQFRKAVVDFCKEYNKGLDMGIYHLAEGSYNDGQKEIVEIDQQMSGLGNITQEETLEVITMFKGYATEMLNSFFTGENKAGETYTMENVHSEVSAYDDILEEFGFDMNFEELFLIPAMETHQANEEAKPKKKFVAPVRDDEPTPIIDDEPTPIIDDDDDDITTIIDGYTPPNLDYDDNDNDDETLEYTGYINDILDKERLDNNNEWNYLETELY